VREPDFSSPLKDSCLSGFAFVNAMLNCEKIPPDRRRLYVRPTVQPTTACGRAFG
jgi:hypothetical protein